MNADDFPGIYLISGIPGAGKTTVARALAQHFQRAVHIESDLLQTFIVKGGLWPNEEPSQEAARQLRLRTYNGCLLARSFAESGFTVVLDDVIVSSRLADYTKELHGLPLRFVLLTPSLETVRLRDASRDEKHVFDIWGHLDEVMRNETPIVGLWLDSTHLTVDETVAAILRAGSQANVSQA